MAQAPQDPSDVTDRFIQFYRKYYRDEIGALAQKYPNEQRSLYVDYDDLSTFDIDLAEDYLAKPDQIQEYAEEALRLYDLPADVKLGRAHVRLAGLPETVDIRNIRVHDDHIGRLIAVQGIVRKATDVRPKITEAAFECQRCGTMTYIPQSDSGFQEPHECQGCERQGPFHVDFDQSEFVDAQKVRVQESPEGLRGGETPQSIDIDLEDDVTGRVTAGDHVTITGVLHIEQQTSNNEKTPIFDLYMDGVAVEIEDEEFEDMNITEEDVAEIVDLSNEPDIHELMIDSVAPSIYGYREEKLAMILQLFSGVTKHLPDGSRIRGDLHMLLIGDPGTGKCVAGDTLVTLADGSEVPIRELVEENLDDPKPVDDGVWDTVDLDVPSMEPDGSLTTQQVTKVWKREAPNRMYQIRTASGRKIEVTPSHPLFVQSNGELTAKKAEELAEREFVATPRTLPLTGDDSLDISYCRSKSHNAVSLDLPDQWTDSLARLIGYIIAEGYVESYDDHTGSVRVTNNDEEILSDTAGALDALGLNYSVSDPREGKSTKTIRCNSGEFVSFLEHLEPSILNPSADQRVPDAIHGATAETKGEFLRAYLDAEGHVSAAERELTVASMSRELLEDVRSLLLSVDISSSIHPRQNGSYRLRVSGESFHRYVETVGFVTERKTASAEAILASEANTNVDVIPGLDDIIKRVRESLALSQDQCGVPRTTYQHYERGDRNPSRDSLESVVSSFEDRIEQLEEIKRRLTNALWDDISDIRETLNISQAELATNLGVEQTTVGYYERTDAIPDGGQVSLGCEAIHDRIEDALSIAPEVERLRSLVDNDLRWDRIESIEAVAPNSEWVYDLEVAGTHSYLSNNLISHNSAMLQYIRNIAPRSVYTSGKGSSSAGLTAAAVRDDFGDGQQWTLEAGALVLADKGIAAVDELDKMRCVTGDTLVELGNGSESCIDELAAEAARDGTIEELPNGRTIRDVDTMVWTMDGDERLVRRPVTAVHEYDAPEMLHTVTLSDGSELTTTADHPFFVVEGGERVERPAAEVEASDEVYVPVDEQPVSADGGVRYDGMQDHELPVAGGIRGTFERSVSTRTVDSVRQVEAEANTSVYDLTVQGTHNFVANGMIIHNSEDRSAMHEALEQQSISVSKAGINATLKSRCSLLGAANPKYGRFDQYEPIGEQIDLEPALISRFDLIFTVTDSPDPETDAKLADHIINTNYAGELHTQRTHVPNSEFSDEEVDSATADVTPEIKAELLRKYIAYAKRNCYPTMTDEAKEVIRQFYVDFRAKGADEDAPVPVTARKLEALVRLSEASARLRLSDTVEHEDAVRVTEIVESCLRDIGMDPETGEFDADIVETGTSKTQRDRIKDLKHLIEELEDEYDEGAPVSEVVSRAGSDLGLDESNAEKEIENLRRKGEVYEPRTDYLRTT